MKINSIHALATLLYLTGFASISQAAEPAPTEQLGAVLPPVLILPAVIPPVVIAETPSPFTLDKPLFIDTTVPLIPIVSIVSGSQSVTALTAPTDLWARIRRGFGMPGLVNDRVRDREQWLSARPDYVLQMTERSRKYMFYIVEELERRNMPSELALLPFIESAFNPQAVSSAKAAGMWQFMPATGRSFDLKQNAFRDDRRDVLASTRAALDYLQKLYVMFGDWHLALAAYNWGEGSVGRAIAKNQRAGLGLTYTDLSMPMETRFYVPKLIALKNIVASPSAFNSSLPLIENHPFFQAVSITRDMDVALAAKLAEVSLEDFKALNPSASRPVILAAGTPQILLPWGNAEIFQRNLDGYAGGRLASWTVWVAPTTLKVAEVAKRVYMTEEALCSINHIPPRVLIKAGSSLLVARSPHLEADVSLQLADHGQMSLTPEMTLKRTVVHAARKDSFAALALRHGVSVASLVGWNKLTPAAALKQGQAVVLFLPTETRTATKGKSAANSKKTTRPTRKKYVKPTRIAKH